MSEDEIDEIREAFNLFDHNGNGRIDPSQLVNAMKNLGFDSKNETIFSMIEDTQNKGR